MDRLLLSTREAAAALGVSRDTVLRLIHGGALAAVDVSVGGRVRVRVRPADLERFIDQHAYAPTARGGQQP